MTEAALWKTGKTPLLDRRGAETDERSESDEAGWWIADKQGLCHPERSEGSPPPRILWIKTSFFNN
jgi:hypothetical protein